VFRARLPEQTDDRPQVRLTALLDSMTSEIGPGEGLDPARRLLDARERGRTVVDTGR
jgi:hypothetical protein